MEQNNSVADVKIISEKYGISVDEINDTEPLHFHQGDVLFLMNEARVDDRKNNSEEKVADNKTIIESEIAYTATLPGSTLRQKLYTEGSVNKMLNDARADERNKAKPLVIILETMQESKQVKMSLLVAGVIAQTLIHYKNQIKLKPEQNG